MLEEPRCSVRLCKHFLGIKFFSDDEDSEISHCSAFPDGIPFGIAHGDNKHDKPYPGDNGIRYEKESE